MNLQEFIFMGTGQTLPLKSWVKTTPGSVVLRVPSDVKFVWFEVQGGGGGGGGTYRGSQPIRKNGGGGGGAGLLVTGIAVVTPGSSITCVVGRGGNGGETYGAGENGEQSAFMNVVAPGGGGGGGAEVTGVGLGGWYAGKYKSSGLGSGADGIILEGNSPESNALGGGGFMPSSLVVDGELMGRGGRNAVDIYKKAENGMGGYVSIIYQSVFELTEV